MLRHDGGQAGMDWQHRRHMLPGWPNVVDVEGQQSMSEAILCPEHGWWYPKERGPCCPAVAFTCEHGRVPDFCDDKTCVAKQLAGEGEEK